MLRHPYILGDPQQRGQNQKSKPALGVTMMPHQRAHTLKNCNGSGYNGNNHTHATPRTAGTAVNKHRGPAVLRNISIWLSMLVTVKE